MAREKHPDYKNSQRYLHLRRNSFLLLYLAGIPFMVFVIGLSIWFFNGAPIIFYALGAALVGGYMAIIAFIVTAITTTILLIIRHHIKMITCPYCGKPFDYNKEVRVKCESVTNNYKTDVNISDNYYTSKTQLSSVDATYRMFCFCSKCTIGSNTIYKTFDIKDLSSDMINFRLRSYFRLKTIKPKKK